MSAASDRQAQVVYFSHGGGPLPILGDPGHASMLAFMRALPERLHKPKVILVVSAHWEETIPTLLNAAAPPMFYDYYGFPQAAYQITYPAPGNPNFADQIAEVLAEQKIPSKMDSQRGFDHGLFIPLKMMYPDASIPCLQLSLIRGLDAAQHIALGRALRGLLNENVLVIGSGFSFHNMQAFNWRGIGAPDPANDAFQDWLIETCCQVEVEADREERLINWEQAPSARYCHPREEHLLPLHVCMGMAGQPAELVFNDQILGKRSVGFLWQKP